MAQQFPVCSNPSCGKRHTSTTERQKCLKNMRQAGPGSVTSFDALSRYNDLSLGAAEPEQILVGGQTWNRDRVEVIDAWTEATERARKDRDRDALAERQRFHSELQSLGVTEVDVPPDGIAAKSRERLVEIERVYDHRRREAMLTAKADGLAEVGLPATRRLLEQDRAGEPIVRLRSGTDNAVGPVPVRASPESPTILAHLPSGQQLAFRDGYENRLGAESPYGGREQDAFVAGGRLKETQRFFVAVPEHSQDTVAQVLVRTPGGQWIERTVSHIKVEKRDPVSGSPTEYTAIGRVQEDPENLRSGVKPVHSRGIRFSPEGVISYKDARPDLEADKERLKEWRKQWASDDEPEPPLSGYWPDY